MKDNKTFERSGHVAGLAWGVHGPFRQYVERMSDGQMAARDGAEILATGEAFFPLDVDSTTPDELRFTGSLEFSGHHGMLAVTVEQPWLQHRAGQWELSVVDPFEPAKRMPFVAVEFTDNATGTTRLTEAGTDVFMGNYSEATLFDPVRIIWEEKDEE